MAIAVGTVDPLNVCRMSRRRFDKTSIWRDKMKSGFTVESAGATLKAVAVAAALACAAGSSMAGAVLNITSFTATAAEFSGTYAYAVDAFQSFSMNALQGGGLYGAATPVNYSANNWNMGPNYTAQTANASATGNLVQFTDASTQLTTAGFNLAAQATPSYQPPVPANYANASAQLQGAFILVDDFGADAAGSITFDLYYTMTLDTPSGGAGTYTQAVLNLLASSDGGGSDQFDDELLSTTLAGGNGSTSGHFTWTYVLQAGQAAYYTLSGSAIAAAVPEPGTYALVGLGLLGAGALSRRRRGAVAA